MPLDSVQLDHVAVAVNDLDAAMARWRSLGATWCSGGGDGVFVNQQVWLANRGKVELITADPGSPESFMTAYLQRFGSGRVHHVTLKVPSPLSAAVATLADEGYQVVDHSEALPFWHEAFLGPSIVGGIIVQVAWAASGEAGFNERMGRPAPEPVDPEAPPLELVALRHPDLEAAARLWTSLGGTLEELRLPADGQGPARPAFVARFGTSPIAVRVEQGEEAGPIGLVMPGVGQGDGQPLPRSDEHPLLLPR